MKPRHHHLRILGYHIYMSREKLRLMPVSNNRGNGLARRITQLRNRRWNKRNGQCEICGKTHEKEVMSLHHILPYRDFPQLAKTHWNLLMVCPRCHFLLHVNLVQQTRLMEQTARQHNIKLEQAYNQSALAQWANKQAKKGATL